jgi:sulfur carrier protein
VRLRNPNRDVEVRGPRQVKVILRDLDIHADAVLVIRGEELLTREDVVEDADEIEIRPVISGGA